MTGALEVGRRGDLESARRPGDLSHEMPGRREQRRIVGVLDARRGRRFVCGLEQSPWEPLRSLRRGELGAIDRRDDGILLDPLQRVDDRERRDHPALAVDGRRHRTDDLGGRQSARRVMDEHSRDISPQRSETGGDGLLPRSPARHDPAEIDAVAGGCADLGLGVALEPGRRDDDDLGGGGGEDAVERVAEDRMRVDADERLGRSGIQSGAGTGGDDDDRGVRNGKHAHQVHVTGAHEKRRMPKHPPSLSPLRTRGPRRAVRSPCPRRSSQRARARR